MEKFNFEQKIEERFETAYSQYEKIPGTYYHGSPYNVDKLEATENTNNIRPGEEGRRAFRDVIFLTTTFDKAIEFAGPNGFVYEVQADAYNYREVAAQILSPKKRLSLEPDIFVALPNDIKIVKKYAKNERRRNEVQSYSVTEY